MNDETSMQPQACSGAANTSANQRIEELERQLASQNGELEMLRREHEYARLFMSAIDQCSESIVFTDINAHFLYVNRSFENNTGYTRSELMGKTPRILKSGQHSTEFYQDMWNTILSGDTCHCRMTNQRKDGSHYVEEANITPVRNDEGQITNFISIATDITELLNNQKALEAANAELIRSNKELEQFAYIASHDLKEPLRAVSSCVQLLEKNYVSQLDSRAGEFIQHALDACKRMRALIDGLLTLSRVQSIADHLEHTPSGLALQKACENLAHAIETSGGRIEHEGLPMVYGHPQMLVHLFQNLVGNAIKFCGSKPPIVHVDSYRDGDFWRFCVRDEGIGIDAAHFGKIFELFHRLHTNEEYSGTGLGLAICQKIITQHGGKIWVESTPGNGSRFYFTLRAIDAPPPPPTSA